MRSHTFRARDQELALGERTALMGLVNVTPDSFYSGSRFADVSAATEAALGLIEAGADVIDIGGESTRPGGRAVAPAEELSRVLPVLEKLRPRTGKAISVDTRRATVAERLLEAGADIVNDVSALADPAMAEVVARSGAGIVLMHMQGTPETMQREPIYDDVVEDISAFLRERIARAEAAGIASESILVDPGIGFGKTLDHNLTLLRDLGCFTGLGKPLLVGTSRKSFIGKLLSLPADRRIFGTAASVAAAVLNGASMVRVHDVKEMRDVVTVTDAIRAGSHAESPSPLARVTSPEHEVSR